MPPSLSFTSPTLPLPPTSGWPSQKQKSLKRQIFPIRSCLPRHSQPRSIAACTDKGWQRRAQVSLRFKPYPPNRKCTCAFLKIFKKGCVCVRASRFGGFATRASLAHAWEAPESAPNTLSASMGQPPVGSADVSRKMGNNPFCLVRASKRKPTIIRGHHLKQMQDRNPPGWPSCIEDVLLLGWLGYRSSWKKRLAEEVDRSASKNKRANRPNETTL